MNHKCVRNHHYDTKTHALNDLGIYIPQLRGWSKSFTIGTFNCGSCLLAEEEGFTRGTAEVTDEIKTEPKNPKPGKRVYLWNTNRANLNWFETLNNIHSRIRDGTRPQMLEHIPSLDSSKLQIYSQLSIKVKLIAAICNTKTFDKIYSLTTKWRTLVEGSLCQQLTHWQWIRLQSNHSNKTYQHTCSSKP